MFGKNAIGFRELTQKSRWWNILGSWSDIGGEHPQNHQFHQFGSVLEVGEHMIKFTSYILVEISMIAWNKIIGLSRCTVPFKKKHRNGEYISAMFSLLDFCEFHVFLWWIIIYILGLASLPGPTGLVPWIPFRKPSIKPFQACPPTPNTAPPGKPGGGVYRYESLRCTNIPSTHTWDLRFFCVCVFFFNQVPFP